MWSSCRFARGLAVAVLGAALSSGGFGPAKADAEAEAAIRGFVADVMSGDAERLAATLAPEFQIQRSDGRGYDKAGYVAGGAAQISTIQDVTDVVATRHQDVLVVRYMLAVEETVRGRDVSAQAPRLTVFRRDGDRWLVVAHSNFARID